MDEVICELESDKATFELPAEADGILRIIGKEGDVLAIGSPICKIEPSGAQPVAAPAPAVVVAAPVVVKESAPVASAAPVASQTIEIKVPAVGESITEVTVASWLKIPERLFLWMKSSVSWNQIRLPLSCLHHKRVF